MMIKRDIYINDRIKPIRAECSDNEEYFGDTPVTIYDDFKISLVLSDDCGAVIGDKAFFPKRGDVMIFRPNEVHFGRFPSLGKYRFISFLIPVNVFEKVFTTSRGIMFPFEDNEHDRVNHIRLPEKEKNRLIDITELIFEMIKNKSILDVIVFSKLIEALSLCNTFYEEQKKNPSVSDFPVAVTKIMSRINETFPEFDGLDRLSEYCGYSVTHLTQTFRRYTNKSIYEYITERRLEYARRLLEKGASVTEACYKSGFSDSSSFITQFKKRFFCTPGKYKGGVSRFVLTKK